MTSVDKSIDIGRARRKNTNDFKANIYELKRKPTNEYVQMLPFSVTKQKEKSVTNFMK